jgi:hypothetical protein
MSTVDAEDEIHDGEEEAEYDEHDKGHHLNVARSAYSHDISAAVQYGCDCLPCLPWQFTFALAGNKLASRIEPSAAQRSKATDRQ